MITAFKPFHPLASFASVISSLPSAAIENEPTDKPCMPPTSRFKMSLTNRCCFTLLRPLKALLTISMLKNDPHPTERQLHTTSMGMIANLMYLELLLRTA